MRHKMLYSTLFVGALAGLCGMLPSPVSADEVVMDNGVRLTGTVTDLAGDIVSIGSDYAESIKVKAGKVTRITTDTPVTIQMKSGEILKGRMITGDDGSLAVEQVAGREKVTIDLHNIAAINPPASQWKGSVIVAGNLQTGNTERSALRVGADAARKTNQDRFSMRFLYDIANEDSSLSSRSAYGALKYDYYFTKKFYGYLGVELLNDSFKDINLRTIVGPGVGYQIWDDPRKALAVEAGFSYFIENLKAGTDKSWLTARLAANYMYRITDTITFTDNLIIYPSLENAADIKLRNEAAIATALGAGWSLRVANTLDYDNKPAADTKNTDSNFMLGLQYTF